jgi:hypothetical protein
METTGAQYLYSGSADGRIHVITSVKAFEVGYAHSAYLDLVARR